MVQIVISRASLCS
uniref:Uncharacterized protein n=1 Tax=Junco hyemalis TaxID=40217 RepID=A0A8C5NLQ3_JUNHY